MKKYRVLKREVWTQTVEIEATSEQEAIQKVRSGGGNIVDDTLEYSHDLSEELWTAEVDNVQT